MKTSRVRIAALGSLTVLLGACGGNVSLGGKSSQPSGAETPKEARSLAGERVLKRPDFSFFSLVVAGDYLYLVGAGSMEGGVIPGGIYRCRKSDCEATFAPFVNGNLGFPQAFGGRLGFTRWDEEGSYGFSTVALSDAKDEQVVIQGLPGGSAVQPLFHDDFVFFSLANDRGIYRCLLPTCAGGPERLARTIGGSAITPRADGNRLLWAEYAFIYRAGAYGTEPAIALLPDDSLSEAPAAALDPDHPPGDQVDTIDVANGSVYANVARSSSGLPCDSYCPHEIVSWPLVGGAPQHFFSSEGRLSELQAFDGELVWLSPSTTSHSADAATVSTCRVEACEATRRDLGGVTFERSTVVADDHDIYWIEAESIPVPADAAYEGGFQINQIRRAPRLPVP